MPHKNLFWNFILWLRGSSDRNNIPSKSNNFYTTDFTKTQKKMSPKPNYVGELRMEGDPRRKYWFNSPPSPFFSSQIPDFQAINTPWAATLDVLGVNPTFRTYSIHTAQHSWMGSLEMGSWAQMWLFSFLISKSSDEIKEMFALLSACHDLWVFHQNPPMFSGRLMCRHSQKQLTQPGFVNASCPCLFVLGAAQILFAGFLEKLGLLSPESWSNLWVWGMLFGARIFCLGWKVGKSPIWQ